MCDAATLIDDRSPARPQGDREIAQIFFYDEGGRFLRRLSIAGADDGVVLDLLRIGQAIASCACRHLVLQHNHPSGDPHPSKADVVATRRLSLLAAFFSATLHDHRISGSGRMFSFRANGLI